MALQLDRFTNASQNSKINNNAETKLDPSHEYAASFPLITSLSNQQQSALNSNQPFWISGPAGCGKSVVSLWRHINNIRQGKNSIMVVYTRSLREYLNQCVAQVRQQPPYQTNDDNSMSVKSLYGTFRSNYEWEYEGEKFEEIVIDEAQDVEIGGFKAISKATDTISINADFNQQLYSNKSQSIKTQEELESILYHNNFNPLRKYTLQKIYRYGLGIYKFVVAFTQMGHSVEARTNFTNENSDILPIVYENIPKSAEIDFLIKRIETYSSTNIVILLPFAKESGCEKTGDSFIRECSVEYYYKQLKDKIQCTHYISNQSNKMQISKIHICTFKSAKGLEFDTVIIPKIHLMDRICILEENQKGDYIIDIKDYYVGMTRAKTNLLLFNNCPLNKVQRFIDMGDSDCYIKKTYREDKIENEITF